MAELTDRQIQIQRSASAIIDLMTGKATIGAGALSGGGKLNPARGLPGGSKVKPKEEPTSKARIFVPITKADEEQQTVAGVVLQPEVVDAQGDIIGADVIRDAAHQFLANYNKATKLGLQHNSFKGGRFALFESYIAPIGFVMNGKTVTEGSWIMVVKILDPKIWAKVKSGDVTGFSIGGKAQVQQLTEAES